MTDTAGTPGSRQPSPPQTCPPGTPSSAPPHTESRPAITSDEGPQQPVSTSSPIRTLNLPTHVIVRKLYSRALPVMKPLIASTICSVVQNTLGIALFVVGALGVAHVAESVQAGAQGSFDVRPYVWWLVGLAVAKALFRYLEQYSGHYVAFTALEQLRLFLFQRIWPQAPALSASTRTGDLLARVTRDIDRIEVFFAHTIAPAISAIVVPIIVVVYVSNVTTVALGLVSLILLLVAAFAVPLIGGRKARNTAAQVLYERGQNLHYVTETIQGVKEIVGFDYGDRRLAEISARSGQVAELARRSWWNTAVRRALAYILQLGSGAVLVALGGQGIAQGEYSIAGLLPALAAVVAAFPVVRGVEELIPDLDKAFASADRLFTLADAVPAVSSPVNPVPLGVGVAPGGARVDFEDVTFTYPETEGRASVRPAVQGVSLVVEPSQRLALVGASGAGKSTLVQLLLRFWDVDEGAIRINGINVRDVELEELRSSIAIVTQATHMFNMTIAENLRLAHPQATDKDIAEACTIACLSDDIAAFPHGLETRVGELGDNLSGGQRQRLSLARALLSNAHILVLDEFTSHLDEITAATVRERLAQARPHVTIIEITHRLTDALDADIMAVIKDGRIVESGHPAQLQHAGGLFTQMLTAGHA